MITYNKWQHPLLFVYLAAVCLLCLLLSKFLLQKNISDMVPRFDQNQVENMLFSIAVHNINSKIKPWNHEIHKIIFSTFFLSLSWHHGPFKSSSSFTSTYDYGQIGMRGLAEFWGRRKQSRSSTIAR